MLVVVKNRDVELLLEALLDFETARCGDVFKINPAKDWGEPYDCFDNLIGILGIKGQWKRINAGELLE